jgi:phosphate-selective porin OprO/OprP
MFRFRMTTCLALMATLFALPDLVRAQDTSNQEDSPFFDLRWRNRPSIQLGEHVRLDLRLKLAYDWRDFDPDIEEETDAWRFRRAGLNGEIANHFEFQIEHDLNEDGDWRDVYLQWRTFRQFQVNAGRFKVPFGREELISISDLEFAFRTLASSIIPPARDTGAMVHGRFLQRGFTYEFGVFDDDGDNGVLQEPQFSVSGQIEDIGPSFAGRVTATPLRPLAETFDTFRVGAAFVSTKLPEGLNSLRGQTVYGTVEFFEPVYVKGRRTRVGVEWSYTPGPAGFSAEWMQAREQRKNQGIGDVDLSDVISTGWYTAGTIFVTGDDKEDFNNPDNPLFDGGIGAIELGLRYEKLQFESAEKVGPAYDNPRAENILGNSDTVWTIAMNWYMNRWLRATVNAIHEELEDPARAPIPGTKDYWSGVARLQIVF